MEFHFNYYKRKRSSSKSKKFVLFIVVLFVITLHFGISCLSTMLQIQTLQATTTRSLASTTTNKQQHSTKSNSTSTTTTTNEIRIKDNNRDYERLSQPQSNSNNVTTTTTQQRKLVFMHIGKTGGTTIGSTFWERCRTIPPQRKRLLKNCWSKINQSGITNETNLSKIMKSWVHYPTTTTSSRNKKKYYTFEQGYTDVLFPIREPISRFISWYGQEQRQRQQQQQQQQRNKDDDEKNDFYNRFFVECFPTIPHLINTLIPKPPNNDSNNVTTTNTKTEEEEEEDNNYCTILIRDAFSSNSIGTNTSYGHLAAGYRFYTSLIDSMDGNENEKQKQTIWSVRTEFLWDDMKNIDIELGGNGYFGTNLDAYKVTHGSEQYYNKSTTTTTSSSSSNSSFSNNTNNNNNNMIYLCCALWPEYLAYRNIIEHSTNLNNINSNNNNNNNDHQNQNQKLVEETYKLTWSKCNNNVTNWDDFETRCKNLDSVLS